jgi:hypothetical protein
VSDSRPELRGLHISDQPGRWRALGFEIDDAGVADVGGVRLQLVAGGGGIIAWEIAGLAASTRKVDGLDTRAGPPARPEAPGTHPNQALAIDHLVVRTPDFDRTAAALYGVGMPLRRVRDAGGFRQGFRRLGPAILELVEDPSGRCGPATFWGVVFVLANLGNPYPPLGRHLSESRTAVQAGRRIATLSKEAGLTPRVAFMDPG